MDKKSYTITPVTGVHIGTGEELSPLDYIIKESKYLKFSSDRILQRLYENTEAMAEFNRISAKLNINELYDFFKANCTQEEDADYSCEITDDFRRNAGTVLQMYRIAGTRESVIPGSSLKGSIRTALLNRYLEGLRSRKNFLDIQRKINDKNERRPGYHERTMQKNLLGFKDAKNDPFRAVSLSDCPFKDAKTQLVGGLDLVPNRQRGSLTPKPNSQIQAEVLRGELLGGNAVSELCISINKDLQKTALPPFKPIDFDVIRKSCNEFYWNEFQNEFKDFYKDINDDTGKIIFELERKLQDAADPKNPKNQFIIRVGRWSQIEFVTFKKEFRKPTLNHGRYGSKRRLFNYNGMYAPLGWCILTAKEQAL